MRALLGLLALAAGAHAMCANNCNGHGRCNTDDQCVCQTGYLGFDCSLRYCPSGAAWGDVPTATDTAHGESECSGRGHCDRSTGRCACDAAFTGEACERLRCSEECSLHGSCESVARYASLNTLGYPEGLWDAEKIMGCVCDDTHHGYKCNYATCPSGDDPMTTGQSDEIQQVDCDARLGSQQLTLSDEGALWAGEMVLRFGPERTAALAFDASAADVKAALEALDGVTNVTVTRAGSNDPAGSGDGFAYQWSVALDSTAEQYSLTPLYRVDEVQRVVCAATGGKFYVTFDGDNSVSVPYDATAAEMEALLEGLDKLADVNVTFSNGQACTSAGNEILVRFQDVVVEGEAGDLPALAADKDNNDPDSNTGLTHATLTPGLYSAFGEVTKGVDSCRVAEQQTMACAATGGSLTLTYNGAETTGALAFDATAAEVEVALEALPSVSDVEVSLDSGAGAGSGSALCSSAGTTATFTFVHVSDGDVAGDVPALTGSGASLTHPTSASLSSPATETVPGLRCAALSDAGAPALARATLPAEPTFMLSFRGATTAAIPASATAAEVQAALEAIKTIDGVDVSFSGEQMCQSPLNSMLVTFTHNFGQLPEMVADPSTVSSALDVDVLSKGEKGSASLNGTKEDEMCSNRGWCDTSTGVCTCYDGFTSSDGLGGEGTRGDCGHQFGDAITECPGEISCSGHGVCSDSPEFACTCAEGWTGGDCSERLCELGRSWFDLPSDDGWAHRELSECSDRGTCDRTSGECLCQTGFSGGACQHLDCPATVENGVCNAHGICMDLRSLAEAAEFRGAPTEFTYGEPMTAATWDRQMVRGCFCDEGYEGHACHLRVCPLGDDPMSEGQALETQALQCLADGGSLTLAFRYAETAALDFDATAAEVEAALEALDTVGDVNVTFSAGAALCTTDGSNVATAEFVTELGPLPALQPGTAALVDDENGDGSAGSGSVEVAIDGASVGGVASVAGGREYLPCSGRGVCDQARGTCECFYGWASSDGFGNRGDRGDCGARIKYIVPEEESGSGAGEEEEEEEEEVRIPTTV